MGHTPYGYRIESGLAVIDEAAASTVRSVYDYYLDGMSLTAAAARAGLRLTHAGTKRLLRNRHYLGDEFYPAIIDKNRFQRAAEEIEKRACQLGRINRYMVPREKSVPSHFTMRAPKNNYDNPLEQAEYLYSLITEVSEDGAE